MSPADEEALLDKMEQELLRPFGHDKPTVPLFHYTDSVGFYGLVHTKQVWATHFRHLNDRDELELGERIIHNEAERLMTELKDSEWQSWLLRNFHKSHRRGRLSRIADVFVASFSEDGDLLSQWRGYAGNGSGFSIGFGSFRLPAEAERPDAQAALTLARVLYDEDEFCALARHQLLDVARGFQRYLEAYAEHEQHADAFAKRAVRIALQRVAGIVPKFKNRAFREEREWRLVAAPMPSREREVVRFRPARSGIVPYMPIELCEEEALLDIAAVVVGPTQDQVAGVSAARMFMSHEGYTEKTSVSESKIPFRG